MRKVGSINDQDFHCLYKNFMIIIIVIVSSVNSENH